MTFPSVSECIVQGSIGVFDRVGWVGCIGCSTSLHEVPDWESRSRLVHERFEIWCAACHLHSLFFITTAHIIFLSTLAPNKHGYWRLRTAGEAKSWNSSVGE